MRKFVALTALLALGLPALVQAATLEFAVDPVHSVVGFKAKHLLAWVPGNFQEFDGKVWLDPDKVAETLKMDATIKTASIDTRNDRRNTHLKSADFFDAEKYPTITFQSKSAKATGKNTFDVTGDLTMHGVTKPVTLHADWAGTSTGFAGTPYTAMELTGTVNRKDFGVNWSKTLDNGGVVVADDVQIDVNIEANVAPAEKAEKKAEKTEAKKAETK
jgi:polyisoprenoid-binding protein YceI